MNRALAGLLTTLSVALLLAAPAEAGWKWKKMKHVSKPGQEFSHGHPGQGYGHGSGYGGGYGYGRGYGRGYGYGSRDFYDQPYATDHRFGSGYARPTGPFGGSAFPPRGWN